ncbi:MAG TPA: glutamate racemase [Fimbriimonadaceae bacterium]|nr:glutamate racemase [Fimbriimonadaceae bacterium]
MKIGVFDSGLGGLAITRAIIDRLPEYDYIYLGDTKRVPYGNRSQETIHDFTAEALNFLFAADCQIVILACNTASAEALRKTQQEYLPAKYPSRRILGVIIPTVEAVAASGAQNVAVLATQSTVDSRAYWYEFERQSPATAVTNRPAPLLVPLIENDGLRYIDPVLGDYLQGLDAETLVLGCTHYSLIKDLVREKWKGSVFSQDEIVPDKLANYLKRHPEHESLLEKSGRYEFNVTDLTPGYQKLATQMFGSELVLRKVET